MYVMNEGKRRKRLGKRRKLEKYSGNGRMKPPNLRPPIYFLFVEERKRGEQEDRSILIEISRKVIKMAKIKCWEADSSKLAVTDNWKCANLDKMLSDAS